ncbi:MAG: hypothetical protein M1821_004413 [Bathelium mastoideum]|nr:MAG: hypothetical protein M1821_004413 [Bathelium mastoideum]
MTYGYDADVLGIIQTAGSNTLRDHGKSLANDLALQRAMSNSVARPLVFVAHSLGGLVVEQALLIARGAAQDHLKALLESTFAIAFMGTPHMGSTKAEWTSILSRLSSILRQTNRNILSVLKPGSEILANVQQEFHTMLDDRGRNRGFHMEIYCFYEEVPVLGIGEVGPLSVPEVAKVWVTRISADDRDKIVPRHSAILPAYQNASLHGDHMSMTKFSDKNDSGYVRVCGVLWLWVSEMENKRHRNTEDDSQDGLRAEYGPIYSGGGSVFVGSNNAGRDITNVGLRS